MRFILFIVLSVLLALILTSSGALAQTLPGLGTCDVSVVGQTKTLTYNNGCGAGEYKCIHIVCVNCFIGQGYEWILQSCSVAGQGICCGTSTPSSQICGYSYASKECGPCKNCDGAGTCGTNKPDGVICQDGGLSGYCGMGNCTIDNTTPYFIDSQENLYIKNLADLKNTGLDIDFIEDVKLKEYTVVACDENSEQYFVNKSELLPAPIFSGNCALETFALTSKSYGQNWKLSGEMWDWILERIANQGKVSVRVNISDGVNNANYSNVLLNVVNDYTKPSVSVSHSIRAVPGGNEVKITAIPQDMFGETSVNIFIDGEQVSSGCTSSSCEVSRVYAEGSHNYYASAIDHSGNNDTSATQTFSFTQSAPTCSESFGQVCSAGTTCSQNTFETADTESCCGGTCAVQIVELPTCDNQGGLAFTPATDLCVGGEVSATGLVSPLRCCVGLLSKIPEVDRLEVYWSNEDGDRIASASLQDTAKCVASGLISEAQLVVSVNNEEISSRSISLPSSSSFLVGKIGTYECAVSIGDKTKVATMRVNEAPAVPRKTSLPVFGLFNIVFVFGLLATYYIITRRDNKLK